ncbi:hypothetical protein HanRHA438_Chr09g0409161 [Helianthus annuus]|nr:hypothetical protein HanRHA438_Chr09g0409161 [Helianthus annuus]
MIHNTYQDCVVQWISKKEYWKFHNTSQDFVVQELFSPLRFLPDLCFPRAEQSH